MLSNQPGPKFEKRRVSGTTCHLKKDDYLKIKREPGGKPEPSGSLLVAHKPLLGLVSRHADESEESKRGGLAPWLW
jgi:hypothetical protein